MCRKRRTLSWWQAISLFHLILSRPVDEAEESGESGLMGPAIAAIDVLATGCDGRLIGILSLMTKVGLVADPSATSLGRVGDEALMLAMETTMGCGCVAGSEGDAAADDEAEVDELGTTCEGDPFAPWPIEGLDALSGCCTCMTTSALVSLAVPWAISAC